MAVRERRRAEVRVLESFVEMGAFGLTTDGKIAHSIDAAVTFVVDWLSLLSACHLTLYLAGLCLHYGCPQKG